MDDHDTRGLCMGRRCEAGRLAAVVNDAFVRLILTTDDFHQRGFSSAVFTADGMNLATAQIQMNAFESDNARKPLPDTCQPEYGSVSVIPAFG
ncbi:hypothetical protein PPGU16_78230 (plasmid) [Paraburkholderia largidicola]|uniref:Uncharacterized protein n=1 Tax=Paraburkholderia largidicola TaxID=3014751 RepID=A0A7I8C108_9BURK|nr:hypothetical protein PPGU16_78230 [Paraburkholderia sp. PGU16]